MYVLQTVHLIRQPAINITTTASIRRLTDHTGPDLAGGGGGREGITYLPGQGAGEVGYLHT